MIGAAVPGLTNYYRWQARYHSMDNMVLAFNQETGQPKQASEIVAWPTSKEQQIKGLTMFELHNFVPFFHPANPGLRTMVQENKMLNQQVKNIPGLKLKPLNSTEQTRDPDNNNSILPDPADSENDSGGALDYEKFDMNFKF